MADGLLTTRKLKIINKEKIAKAVLEKDVEVFVLYISSPSLNSMTIYPTQKAQMNSLFTNEVTILIESVNFANVFSKKLVNILLMK